MVQGRAPFDAKAAADNADIVVTMSKLPFAAFVEGTDKGAPTRAKPEIWTEIGQVQGSGAARCRTRWTKLDAAAKTGNLDNIKAAFGSLGASCKACHDDYRKEKYSSN